MNRKRKAEEDVLEVAEKCSFGCYLKENCHRNFKPENISFLNMPNITRIEYFSDGCAGQYKNFKKFLNLCHHKNDFGLDANWSFVVTFRKTLYHT